MATTDSVGFDPEPWYTSVLMVLTQQYPPHLRMNARCCLSNSKGTTKKRCNKCSPRKNVAPLYYVVVILGKCCSECKKVSFALLGCRLWFPHDRARFWDAASVTYNWLQVSFNVLWQLLTHTYRIAGGYFWLKYLIELYQFPVHKNNQRIISVTLSDHKLKARPQYLWCF